MEYYTICFRLIENLKDITGQRDTFPKEHMFSEDSIRQHVEVKKEVAEGGKEDEED